MIDVVMVRSIIAVVGINSVCTIDVGIKLIKVDVRVELQYN